MSEKSIAENEKKLGLTPEELTEPEFLRTRVGEFLEVNTRGALDGPGAESKEELQGPVAEAIKAGSGSGVLSRFEKGSKMRMALCALAFTTALSGCDSAEEKAEKYGNEA
jgi:hypothetical protein